MSAEGGERTGRDGAVDESARERRDLEARVYGAEPQDPAALARLRALLASERDAASAAAHPALPEPAYDAVPGEPGPDPELSTAVAPAKRVARTWLAGGAVAVVLAGLVGAGLAHTLGAPAGSDAPAATTTKTNPLPLGEPAVAQSLGEEYFDQRQTAVDIPDVTFPRIDPDTTRRVLAQWERKEGDADVWVARGIDDSYCLIMSVGSSRGASSCTAKASAAKTGVRLDLVTAGGASISARWNISAGILEVSPFPAESPSEAASEPSPTP